MLLYRDMVIMPLTTRGFARRTMPDRVVLEIDGVVDSGGQRCTSQVAVTDPPCSLSCFWLVCVLGADPQHCRLGT